MSLDFVVDVDVAVTVRICREFRRQVTRMIRAAAVADQRFDYDVALRLCGDGAMRDLNHTWRGKNRPTDVLAFAQREAASASEALLGDIVISVETARRQAKRGLPAELLHLAAHGLCHLLGYDHPDDAQEAIMNARAAALCREARRRGRIRPA